MRLATAKARSAVRPRRGPEPFMPYRRDRRTFIGAAVGCIGLLLVMICIVGAMAVQRSGNQALRRHVVRSLETQVVLSRVFSLTQDAETGQRGYVLTGDPAFLSPYDQARADLGPELKRLDGLLANDPDQVADVARLRDLVRSKLQELALTIELRRQGRGAEALALVKTMQGKQVMDGVRATVADMGETLSRDTATIMRRADAVHVRISILIGALLFACLVLAVIATLVAIGTLNRHLRWIGVLADQRDAASRDKRATSNFLANMSHEIRTPLTSILGFSRLLHQEPHLPETVARYNDRVQTAAQALLAVVNDVLDFSKLEAGEARIERTNVQPAKIVEEVMALLEEQAAYKGITILRTVAAGVPAAVSTDPDRLRQIILNLAGNAVKFTETGGVQLELSWRDPDRLRVDVVDTGEGISPNDQALLFQRFAQVDGSTSRLHGGTGLGLAICKGLVDAMGGEIGVESAPGAGSRFWFEIPTPVVATVGAPAASHEGSDVAADGRVLLVDDNEANLELVRLVLDGLGLAVTVAGSGEEAVAAVDRFPFDLILMDIRMPGMGGVAAMKQIRWSQRTKPRTPILAFTAEADVRTGDRLKRAGFDGHVAKPITPAELVKAVVYWTSGDEGASEPDAQSA